MQQPANSVGAFMMEGAGKVFLPVMQGGVSDDMYLQTPQLKVDILRDQAASYGISPTRIETLLRNAYSQNYVYLIKRPTNQYQVILETEDQARLEPQNLDLLYIKSDDGRTSAASAVAKWSPTIGPQSVNHLNQFTSVTFNFNKMPDVSLGEATDFIEKKAAEIVPSTMRADFQGDALTFKNTVADLTVLMVLAVFVMYVILGILYESYLHPITVLSSLPVALVGGLLTLKLFGQEASLYAYIGMFMLMGIVKKNGIMIVDFAIQRVAHGETAEQSIHDASMDRFRPIIMTTLAAVMGALPIALGFGADGSSRRPLGLVIVGGLIVSQFITLYVTPVIYLYLELFQEKVLDRTSFFKSTRIAHEEVPGGTPLMTLGKVHKEGNGEGNGNGHGETSSTSQTASYKHELILLANDRDGVNSANFRTSLAGVLHEFLVENIVTALFDVVGGWRSSRMARLSEVTKSACPTFFGFVFRGERTG